MGYQLPAIQPVKHIHTDFKFQYNQYNSVYGGIYCTLILLIYPANITVSIKINSAISILTAIINSIIDSTPLQEALSIILLKNPVKIFNGFTLEVQI